jgi:hypothetical protein
MLRLWMRGNSGEGDFVIAETAEQAHALLEEVVGVEDAAYQVGDEGWEEWPADKELTICQADEPGRPKETHTVAEWLGRFTTPTYWFGWA